MTELESKRCELDGRSVAYTLRVSPRARWMHMTVSPDAGLIVTVPRRYRSADLERFLTTQRRWIAGQLARVETLRATLPVRWPYGETLPFLGREHRVELRAAASTASVARTDEPAAAPPAVRGTPAPAEVMLAPSLIVSLREPSIDSARLALRAWFGDQTRRWCGQLVQAHGERLGITWWRVRVGSAKHCWGSCSVTGSLSFNWRLVMAPPEIVEYVVIHELLHRRQMNHTARFWALMAEHVPSYRASVAWLKTYGPYLRV